MSRVWEGKKLEVLNNALWGWSSTVVGIVYPSWIGKTDLPKHGGQLVLGQLSPPPTPWFLRPCMVKFCFSEKATKI